MATQPRWGDSTHLPGLQEHEDDETNTPVDFAGSESHKEAERGCPIGEPSSSAVSPLSSFVFIDNLNMYTDDL